MRETARTGDYCNDVTFKGGHQQKNVSTGGKLFKTPTVQMRLEQLEPNSNYSLFWIYGQTVRDYTLRPAEDMTVEEYQEAIKEQLFYT